MKKKEILTKKYKDIAREEFIKFLLFLHKANYNVFPDDEDTVLTIIPISVIYIESAIEDILEDEITEMGMSACISMGLVAALASLSPKIKEEIGKSLSTKELKNVGKVLEVVSTKFPDEYDTLTQNTMSSISPLVRFWLGSIEAIDLSKGVDKTINYTELEEFIVDVSSAKFKGDKIFDVIKEIIPMSLNMVRSHYRNFQQEEGTDVPYFASTILSTLAVGVGTRLEKKKEIVGEDKEFKKIYNKLEKQLFEAIKWWINKQFSYDLKQGEITYCNSFNPPFPPKNHYKNVYLK